MNNPIFRFMADRNTLNGSCFCGAIQFTATEPKWCAYCHCSMCRRLHGAPFVTWVGFDRGAVMVTDGQELIREYRASPTALRQSCAVCGSPLFFSADRWPDEIHVVRAAFGDDVDVIPKAHYFYDDRAPWVEIQDSWPKYGGATGTEPII